MDKLDAANTWETIYCRTAIEKNIFTIPKNLPEYDDYELKYQPASGHILGPVSMLITLGHEINSREVKNLISYFKNYLIGMQINDDAHDWEEDMQRGHLSTVVVMMLEDWKKKYPNSKKIDLEKDKQKLQQLYWFTTIKRACKIAILHAKKSRASLEKMTIIKNPAPLEHLITKTEAVALEALAEQKRSVDFLEEF
jgi:hypothetical protein